MSDDGKTITPLTAEDLDERLCPKHGSSCLEPRRITVSCHPDASIKLYYKRVDGVPILMILCSECKRMNFIEVASEWGSMDLFEGLEAD